MRIKLIPLVTAAILALAQPAIAWVSHGGGGWHGGGGGWHGGGWGWGGAALGGAILGGVLASPYYYGQPYYATPQPTIITHRRGIGIVCTTISAHGFGVSNACSMAPSGC